MGRRRRHEEEEEPPRGWGRGRWRAHDAPPRQRNASARLAYCVLVGGGALLLTRATLATLIQVHGDGMAPTILDGESVIMARGTWGIEAGDIVVYDPTPPAQACEDPPAPAIPSRPSPADGPQPEGQLADEARDPLGQLHDVSVVDVDDVEDNWERVRDRGKSSRPRNFRVGRVLAVPGDTVTFHVPEVALGLVVNGSPVHQKLDEPIRLALAPPPAPASGSEPRDRGHAPRLRTLAWETLGHTRYPVLLGSGAPSWVGMALPEDLGPIEVIAEGYLVLADNRDEGACCDSRSLGWIAPERLRGEVVLRLAGDPGAAPDSDPSARGLARLP